MTRMQGTGTAMAAAILVLLLAGSTRGATFTPAVIASIHDEPRDSLGDTFNNPPFEGLLREQATREDRAIQEFDVTSVAGQVVTSATLSGRVSVNNAFDVGIRNFDFSLYQGNGAADLTDFEIPSVVVGSGFYHPPNDTFFDYSFDVTSEVQSLVAGGATFIGLKVDCTSDPNFPSILSDALSQLDITAQPPPSCTLTTPAPGATVSGAVVVTFDATDPQNAPVTSTFDYSLDGGVTWLPATAAAGSPISNPDPGRPTPFAGVEFHWDSPADNVGAVAVQAAEVRVTVDSGGVGTCQVSVSVDNTSLCPGPCGDCNLDTTGPDIIDALTAAQIAAAILLPSAPQTGCCDANSDTVIDILDALLIAQSAASLPVTLVCP